MAFYSFVEVAYIL